MDENEQLNKEISRLEEELRQNPDNPNSAILLAESVLSAGDYRRGWRLYTSRYSHPNFTVAHEYAAIFKTYFSQTLPWEGQSLHKKTLLVLHEQGCGDLFMVARYLQKLKSERGATVKLFVLHESLVSLFKHQTYIDSVSSNATSNILEDFDFWCLSLDFPLIFQTELNTIPPNCLLPNQKLVEKWKQKLPCQNKLRVGLVWRGNPDFVSDKTRSLPSLSILSPLFNIPDVQFFSLQKGEGEAEATAAAVNLSNFTNLSNQLADYAQTAALIESLDLVISSDTGVAHLTGALGNPVWLMTPGLDTCWRWLLNRTDSPWYPSMRLFRQSLADAELADWSKVVSEIAVELEKLSVKKRRLRLLNPLNWF